jgi:hypothetical protein
MSTPCTTPAQDVTLSADSIFLWCRVCACNVLLHHLSEKPWKCGRSSECPGLETAELDALIEEWLARAPPAPEAIYPLERPYGCA